MSITQPDDAALRVARQAWEKYSRTGASRDETETTMSEETLKLARQTLRQQKSAG